MMKLPSASELEFCIIFQTKLLSILRILLDLSVFISMIKMSQKLREEEEKNYIWGAISYKGKMSIEFF